MPADNAYDNTHPLALKTDYRASCHSHKPFKAGYWAYDTYRDEQGHIVQYQRFIHHTMSTKCRQILPMPECEGCTAPKDLDYLEKWK